MSLYKSNLYDIIKYLFAIDTFLSMDYFGTYYCKDAINELIIRYFKLKNPTDISFIKELDKDELKEFIDKELEHIFNLLDEKQKY